MVQRLTLRVLLGGQHRDEAIQDLPWQLVPWSELLLPEIEPKKSNSKQCTSSSNKVRFSNALIPTSLGLTHLLTTTAQLAQANAEAEAARQAAAQASQPTAVAYATTATAVTAAPAVPVQATAAPAEVGRSMLNQALSSGNGASVEDLVALKKQLNVVQMMCVRFDKFLIAFSLMNSRHTPRRIKLCNFTRSHCN